MENSASPSRTTSLLWAKAPERLASGQEPYPIAAHLLDTAAAAGALWDCWLSPRLRRLLTQELAPDDESEARHWVQFAAGLHDLGKASSAFQTQAASRRPDAGWREQHIARLATVGLPGCTDLTRQALATEGGRAARRHELVGLEALLPGAFAGLRRVSVGGGWLPLVVAGHHGHWQVPAIGDVSPALLQALTDGPWGDVQHALLLETSAALGRDLKRVPVLGEGRAGVVVTLVTGLVILADWLASADRVVESGFQLMAMGASPEDGAGWLAHRAEEMPRVVRECLGGFSQPVDAVAAILGSDAAGRPRAPRPLQQDALSIGDGAWFVEYPTGEGKTEAALLRHLAEPGEGLIFGLPTRATTDAMQARLERMLGASGNAVVLSHQFAAAHRVECSRPEGLAWFSSPVRRLMAPVVAATCDQVLTGALRRKHAALRLLALANHHVVLDEVHTFDHYQTGLLEQLMAWWGATGARVTILSATLPLWQQRTLAEAYLRQSAADIEPVYPSHRLVGRAPLPPSSPPLSAPLPPLPVRMVRADDADAEHVRWALAVHGEHPGCHLAVVRSTVDDAVATARALEERWRDADIDVICLHSRMTVAHRREVETSLVARLGPEGRPGRPVAIVATQVIEASLDLDLDLMSTDLAPAPALIQRAGRLWRFRDPSARRKRFEASMPPGRELHVVVRTQEGRITDRSSVPYFSAELRRVEAWLAEHPVVLIPDMVQHFVDATGFDLDTAEAEQSADEIGLATCQRGALQAAAAPLRGKVVDPVRRTKYSDLAALTGDGVSVFDPADGMLMGTRFSERDSVNLVLLDGPYGAGIARERLAATTDAQDLLRALDAVVPVSGRVLSALDLGGQGLEWNPKNLLLKSFAPVDSGQIAAARLTYDHRVGLSWSKGVGCP